MPEVGVGCGVGVGVGVGLGVGAGVGIGVATGVTAGVAAGMTVYGYCAFTPSQRLIDAGAYRTFNTMAKLPALLRGPYTDYR